MMGMARLTAEEMVLADLVWIDDPELSPYRIREGRAPQVDGEVLIDAYSAREGDIALGDTVEIRLPDLIESEVVGIATFGVSLTWLARNW